LEANLVNGVFVAAVRVKVCGIMSGADAEGVALAGADAVGMNFFKGPRKIDLRVAVEILAALPPMVMQVGLVEHIDGDDPNMPSAVELERKLNLRTFQTYTTFEQQKLSPRWNDLLDWWVVAPMISRASLSNLRGLIERFASRPQAILCDTYSPKKEGGTGKTFNWEWIAEAREAGELAGLPPLVLAGGLTPENVAEAVRIARPYAVDVSSGVEVKGKAGVKDLGKVREFVAAAKSV
jgi:phosphoribosylanthranilate isomerase